MWTRFVEYSRKALIAWEKLCWPLVAGGLNFVDIPLQNRVVSCKLLWHVCRNKEKLWVPWIHAYYIKGQIVCDTYPKNASWVIQKTFKAKAYVIEAGYDEQRLAQLEHFSIEKVYRQLQGNLPKVLWRKLICNNYGCKKWTFILRLAIVGRLATEDKLVRWRVDVDPICPLCKQNNESVNHLSAVSADIWEKLLQW